MARTRFLPETEKPEPRYGKKDADWHTAVVVDVPQDDSEGWEFQSVERFVEFLIEEDRDTFTTAELVSLAKVTGIFNTQLRIQLEGFGLRLVPIQGERKFRTFGDNPHDRWTNSEARRMNGGGGGDSIMGIAGRVG